MTIIEILLIALSLGMDCFAISFSTGIAKNSLIIHQKKKSFQFTAWLIACIFGIFHISMNLIGWFVGYKIARFVDLFDHWIAFPILAAIGGKMIWENIFHKEDTGNKQKTLNIKYLTFLSLATSMDVLAVGFSFSFILQSSQVYTMSIIIGITALLMSLSGAYMGHKISKKIHVGIAEILGGIILIGIGVKILLEHL